MSIFREFNINMVPGKPPLIIHVSQYESDFVYTFHLVSGKSVLAIPNSAIAVIRGTKRDGNGYSVEAALDAENHKVVVMGDPQLTACAGRNVFELAIINDEKTICTANFFLDVERAPLDAGTIQSDSVLRELQAIIDSAATATQAAEEASASAAEAAESARTLTIDPTLTQSGQAADAKVVGNLKSALKSSVDYLADNGIKRVYPTWEVGSIDGTTGDDVTSSTNVRSIEYIDKNAVALWEVAEKTGSLYVYRYNYEDGVYTYLGRNQRTGNDTYTTWLKSLTGTHFRFVSGQKNIDYPNTWMTLCLHTQIGDDIEELKQSTVENENETEGLKRDAKLLDYTTGAFTVSSGAHSSTKDRVEISLEQGTTYYISVESTIQSMTYQVYEYDSNNNGVKNGGNRNVGRTYTITSLSNAETIGLYCSAQESAYTLKILIEKENSILRGFDGLKAAINGISGSAFKSFTINAGSNHSSSADRIPVDIVADDEYFVFVTSNVASSFLTNYQVYEVYDNDSATKVISNIRVGNYIKLTASQHIKSIGIYVGAQSEKAEILALVLTRESILYSVIKTTMSSLFVSSEYNPIDGLDSKIAEYSALFKTGSTDVDAFMFFTDPHVFPHTANERTDDMQKAIGTLEYTFNNCSAEFICCGGDWLSNSDTQDEACYKLGKIDGFMRAKFGENYYPVFGNHDGNYQGKMDSESEANTGELPQNTINNLWFSKYGKAYYEFETLNTKYYVFDTGTDWQLTMTSYRWEQVDWFANKLISDNADHSVMLMHIFTTQNKENFESNPAVQQLANNLTLVAQAYNARTTITLNNVTYDFTQCTGKVAYLLCGHSHYDSSIVWNDIPVIITINSAFTPSFDLCYVDYNNAKMTLIRIGSGDNREFTIIA